MQIFSLLNEVALITGGGSGIGLSTAKAMVEACRDPETGQPRNRTVRTVGNTTSAGAGAGDLPTWGTTCCAATKRKDSVILFMQLSSINKFR